MHACSCSYTDDDDVSHYYNYLIFPPLWIMIIMHCMHGESRQRGHQVRGKLNLQRTLQMLACRAGRSTAHTHWHTCTHNTRMQWRLGNEQAPRARTTPPPPDNVTYVLACIARRGKEEEELTPYSTCYVRTCCCTQSSTPYAGGTYSRAHSLSTYWPDHRLTHSIHYWAGGDDTS